MQRFCVQCQAAFEITDADLAFYDKVSPVYAGQKFLIPPPTHCPDCRQQRRLAICNELNLHHGTCDLCRKDMITQFPPGRSFPVYCRECWHSDRWDSRSYGRDVDFSRPFFEQFAELRSQVPALGLDVQGTLVNCEYIHFAGSSKNCYLIMHADFCEDCMYGYGFKRNTSCVDGFYNLHCELCYGCIDFKRCTNVVYLHQMTPRLARIRNGSLALPPELAKEWKGASVYVLVGDDWFTVKRVGKPSLQGLLPRLRKAGTGLTQKDVDAEVSAVRKELRQKRQKR